ncbi:zinc-ribbon and DUF3426 domain-containing protein [Methylomonas sp. 2BW1-5-20]|uniref:zinc-ribbon and DUF3426 domain-containing protein n=1 Tax=Methylomonas sp. 2BW1-5-20 TaxID=3376686 RepID=UPI004051C6BF
MLINLVEWMYSRCPHCDKQHRLTVKQLRQQRGLLICSACGEYFDGLRFLSDHKGKLAEDSTTHFLEKGTTRQQTSAVWLSASVVMLSLLAAQVIYFEGYRLCMQSQLRTALEKLCAAVACQLPIYKKLDDLTVTHGALHLQANRSYLFTAALSNQSPFSQAAPNLKLTLLNFNGQPTAERVFSAPQFLVGSATLAAEQTVEIHLNFVAPNLAVGGYILTLL